MTTLGTHPFVPCQHRLGSPATCLQCSKEAFHPVHDWLTINAIDVELESHALSSITPEEMVQLENLPNGEPLDLDSYLTRVDLPRATVSNPTMLARFAERLRAGR